MTPCLKKANNVSSISFRKPLNGRGFVEFVVPITLNCTREQLAHVIRTNQAPDRSEHTGVFQLINLNPDERFSDYATWSKDKPGGRDLYPSIVREASRSFNAPKFGNATQRHMPNYRGEALPVSLFNPTVSVYQHSLLSDSRTVGTSPKAPLPTLLHN